MIDHLAYVKAINGKAFKWMNNIQSQWDEFSKIFESTNAKENCAYLKQLILDNDLFTPFNNNTPQLFIMHPDVFALQSANNKVSNVYSLIENYLFNVGFLRLYKYRNRGNLIPVYVFLDDYNKLSNHLKNRLGRVYVNPV